MLITFLDDNFLIIKIDVKPIIKTYLTTILRNFLMRYYQVIWIVIILAIFDGFKKRIKNIFLFFFLFDNPCFSSVLFL